MDESEEETDMIQQDEEEGRAEANGKTAVKREEMLEVFREDVGEEETEKTEAFQARFPETEETGKKRKKKKRKGLADGSGKEETPEEEIVPVTREPLPEENQTETRNSEPDNRWRKREDERKRKVGHAVRRYFRTFWAKTEGKEEARGCWKGKWDFFLSCLGVSVGIGNVWRFPYLVFENGGGAFLVPYLIMVFLCGQPLYFAEFYLGQYSGKSFVRVWSSFPVAKGFGVAAWIFAFIFVSYYNVVIAYTLYYASASFGSDLPWSSCRFEWAQNASCASRSSLKNYSSLYQTPSELYWNKKVLGVDPSVSEPGGIKWDLFLALAIAWTTVAAGVCNGIQTTAKVVGLSVAFSYLVLIFLFIYGVSQPGAENGIIFFLFPSWDKLLNLKIWTLAAGQMFYSLSVATGSLVTFASFNHFHYDIYKDARILVLADTFTSVLAGFVVFSQLGVWALRLDVAVSEITGAGFELAFVAIPEALNALPLRRTCTFLFFFLLFSVGIESELGMVQNLVIGILDLIPKYRIYKRRFYLCLCLCAFLFSIPCVTRGGFQVVRILDGYVGGVTFVVLAAFECVVLSCIYGIRNVGRDVRRMLGLRTNVYWKTTLGFCCPFVLFMLFVHDLVAKKNVVDDPDYVVWPDVVSRLLTAFTLIPIPIWALIQVKRQKPKRWRLKLKKALRPSPDWLPRNRQTEKGWSEAVS